MENCWLNLSMRRYRKKYDRYHCTMYTCVDLCVPLFNLVEGLQSYMYLVEPLSFVWLFIRGKDIGYLVNLPGGWSFLIKLLATVLGISVSDKIS